MQKKKSCLWCFFKHVFLENLFSMKDNKRKCWLDTFCSTYFCVCSRNFTGWSRLVIIQLKLAGFSRTPSLEWIRLHYTRSVGLPSVNGILANNTRFSPKGSKMSNRPSTYFVLKTNLWQGSSSERISHFKNTEENQSW